ncbi:site-specific DNA-methyltransferase [Heyndrickxia sporothermodurans]|uniref:DNA-methyltransferase n=1 Tax=Heyndrickxia sporothermodurans TaxID=46224 RepID=UPI002E2359AB|nr:site-specific DNA-methyltransferase [Heyndrickxia sporothermodurans]MED3697970.1 site-specific DNA-methyltransferase [Heyndrickxia sporothermodurans]
MNSKEILGELELNRIYQRDCIEGIRMLPEQSIDLIITDPPYLMNYRSNRRVKNAKFNHIANDVNSHDLISDYLSECQRVLKDDTAIYVFCSWHQIDFFKTEFEKHFKLKNIIVWNKNNHGSGDLKGAYAPKHEFILYGHKGRSLFREKRIPDVIDCAKIPSLKLTHPTEKPTELLEIFIRNNSDEGDIILDGFAGTGSLPVAAVRNNRRFIAFEIESNYIEIANKRLDNEEVIN